MKIASTNLHQESSSVRMQQHEIRQSLATTVNGRQQINLTGLQSVSAANVVFLSDAGRAAQSNEADAIDESIKATADNDPILSLIRALVGMLTGHPVKVFDASQMARQSAAPVLQSPAQESGARTVTADTTVAAEYNRQESYSESEQTSFQATGVVRTASGEEISFSLSLAMSRSYHEESNASIKIGNAQPTKDPLVLNFNGTAAQLTNQRFSFDLDSDGHAENINFATGGSGFLALDRDGDGKINNGKELFGASSGDGFAELSTLDSDGNGWIDSGDAAYDSLRIWSKSDTGKDQLLTLSQAGVGALSVASVDSAFSLKNSSNALQAQIRASGVYLRENGQAGSIQQVDLTV